MQTRVLIGESLLILFAPHLHVVCRIQLWDVTVTSNLQMAPKNEENPRSGEPLCLLLAGDRQNQVIKPPSGTPFQEGRRGSSGDAPGHDAPSTVDIAATDTPGDAEGQSLAVSGANLDKCSQTCKPQNFHVQGPLAAQSAAQSHRWDSRDGKGLRDRSSVVRGLWRPRSAATGSRAAEDDRL